MTPAHGNTMISVDTNYLEAGIEASNGLIHFVWVGTTLPSAVQVRINACASVNANCKVLLWNEESLQAVVKLRGDQVLERLLNACPNAAAVSDVARFALLEAHGGIYLDADMEPVRPLYELFNLEGGFVARESRWLLNGAAIGLPRGSLFARLALRCMDRAHSELGKLGNFLTGPPLVTELARALRLLAPDRAPAVLAESAFFPINPFRFPVARNGAVPPYAVHLYDHSWGAGTELNVRRRLLRTAQLITPRDVAVGARRSEQKYMRAVAMRETAVELGRS